MTPRLFCCVYGWEVNASDVRLRLGLSCNEVLSWQLIQLAFADDTALVANSKENLQRLLLKFNSVCEKRKLRVNVDKIYVMRCS